MSFLPNAQAALASGNLGLNETAILTYLLANAVGRANAKSWRVIELYLTNLPTPIVMEMQEFQHGLLAASRADDYFIGSSNKGFFIIDSEDDAKASASYYDSRIQAETTHLNQLRRICRNHNPAWTV